TELLPDRFFIFLRNIPKNSHATPNFKKRYLSISHLHHVFGRVRKTGESDEANDIVVNALHYQVKVGHVKITAFVIMPNHLHLIWRIQNECGLEDVQRDFLKFTARELLRLIKTKKGAKGVEELFVGLRDRAFQVWKRNSMSIDLIHDWFFKQKFEYLHNNPCQPHWQLATLSEDYKFSSASFYDTGEYRFGFLTHHSEI
ncbi:MAG: hypothetical protein IM620_03575, partial [Cytophagales bacterium]|nr:hypothetical protein [Cytophagales bacterium]MCA6382540.1 hypothetical protein [Cytophagales bacterium]